MAGILDGLDSVREKLKDHSLKYSEAIKLVNCFYDGMKGNIKRAPDRWSKENWRFSRALHINKNNQSPEKKLEKWVAWMSERGRKDWANQVPTASGLINRDADKKRSIDLVYRIKKSDEYDFIELKVDKKAGDAYYAAVEILSYGVLYLIHRTNITYNKCKKSKDKELLKATTIHLKVLAPVEYYDGNDLRRYQNTISSAIRQYTKKIVPGLKMDFTFEVFSPDTVIARKSLFIL